MIWQNPWAWLGLGAIAVPTLIHLLGRDRAPRQSFPSLRFIEIAELPPTRRTRLHDLLLLATRVAIVVIAAAALAQPLLVSAGRRAAITSRLARAVVVDTSASMLRQTPTGTPAVDSARREAKQLASAARTSIVVETSSPSAAVDGAVSWLQSQPFRRELIVISDFQTGTIDSAAIASVPASIGIRLAAIATQREAAQLERRSLVRDGSVVAHIDVAGSPTIVSWTLGSRADSLVGVEPQIAVDARDRQAVDALTSATRTVGVVTPIDTTKLVTVVFPGAADRAALVKRATRVSSPKLIDLVTRLRADSVSFAEDTTSGAHRLLAFSNDSAATVRSALLLGRIRRELSGAAPTRELDPSTISGSVIASWQRPPAATPTRDIVDLETGPSDARWFWIVALLLIAAESWLRRERPAVAIQARKRVHDRAA